MPAPFDPSCIFGVLAEHDVDYVLIGGLAAVLRGSTAMTNDADIVPAHEPGNLERLSAALVDLRARLRVEDTPSGIEFDPHPALIASMAMLNTTTRCGDLDLTFAPPALDDYGSLVENSDVFDIEGRLVRVAALADIIRSKQASGRAKDRATLPVLLALQEEIDAQDEAPS
ncbi:MAG: hypothetical protein QNJ12_09400 [Ilumatobacter sp.]|uniref:hypothetical protein n=1 Tax=Ilumatobacter sp. TaxID=1967498 RepID=UPI002606682B|nr:hypothetical protein [Ilumatobacter sp.]MDJ0768999.1 hypothetical protein [Ilumatobacter sp.]